MSIIAVKYKWSYEGATETVEQFPSAASARRWIKRMADADARNPDEAHMIIVQKIGFS